MNKLIIVNEFNKSVDKKTMIITIRTISRMIISHFRFIRSMITPANSASKTPGMVAAAMIFPRASSDPVSSSTSQLILIKFKPNPISEMALPRKKRVKVGFLKSVSKLNSVAEDH